MKTKKYYFSLITVMILGLLANSCNSAAENKADAQENLDEANKEMDEANEAYLQDIENYRAEMKILISRNDSLITSHKAKMKKYGLTDDPYYKNEIEKMETKNKRLKNKMDNYEGEGEDNWTIFKEEFNHDINELGEALKDLTIKNT